MLQKLVIKNIALIDNAEISFTKGLNVLSGETGAGKSVILESLNFVLGAKADKTLIRTGTAECFVQAVFDISDNVVLHTILNELDIEDDDVLILSRKFTIDGKSSIKVNGESVSLSMLKKLTAPLVDVHGQSEHFYLLKSTNQLNLIDKRGGEKIVNIKNLIKENHLKRKIVINELDKLGGSERDRELKLDLLKYQVNEIESCALKDGEEEYLLEAKQKLSNQEKILTALNYVKQALSEENGASDILFNAEKQINTITDYATDYANLAERIDTTISELCDISDTASNLIENFDLFDFDINSLENRLDTIKTIKKKYGQTYQEIIEHLQNSKDEIEKLENFNDLANGFILEKTNLENKLYNLYLDLSKERKAISESFSKAVLTELKELGMPKADFKIVFNEVPILNECQFNSTNGIDDVEFQFSANNGEPLKSLSSVISGGEMSRFMLAVKAQTAKSNDISTFIFDEIDVGISGVTAKVVAEKFAKISKNTQIIAISHLPQISSMADNNLLIVKTETSQKTTTNVKKLSKEEKVNEIIRLIGGSTESESAVIHAKELIAQADGYKSSI